MKKKTIIYDIRVPGEYSAGLRGFTDWITVIVDSGDPGGRKNEFEEFIRDALMRWYDGGYVTIVRKK